jgi:hypothetical protein
MRSMLDSEFDDMHGVDVLQDLDSGFFEADSQENEADRDSVLLECNGELLDAGSVRLVAVRKSACDFETLLFICPRCNEPHESLRFR